MTCCTCIHCIKDALLKTAGKKRLRDVLTARILFEEALEDSTVYCDVCDQDFEYCPHNECCADPDGDPDWDYCPWCGAEL